ncbi:MAG TPA: metal-sensitive transcriptional regulator [Candidatus Angelobacter sp.]|nr:metal-sensitive transcriptional regulator [Candidatus Angelobacter sp.]
MIGDIKRKALQRAKILEGQMRGVQKMIDDEEYCMDILTQSLAIQKSVNSLSKLILENHIRTHVRHQLSSGNESDSERSIEELLRLYEITNIRSKVS